MQRAQSDGELRFQRPSNSLDLNFYKPADNGFSTSYKREIAFHEGDAQMTVAKARESDRSDIKKKVLRRALGLEYKDPNERPPPVASDPSILRMAREIRSSEGKEGPDFMEMLLRKHKTDHITGIFTEPRRDHDNLSNSMRYHVDFGADERKVDKSHFMKKNFYTEYSEALAQQKGLQGAKR